MAPGTSDDAMWPLLARKLQVVGRALDGHATGTATGTGMVINNNNIINIY